jgi:hypothetical protein
MLRTAGITSRWLVTRTQKSSSTQAAQTALIAACRTSSGFAELLLKGRTRRPDLRRKLAASHAHCTAKLLKRPSGGSVQHPSMKSHWPGLCALRTWKVATRIALIREAANSESRVMPEQIEYHHGTIGASGLTCPQVREKRKPAEYQYPGGSTGYVSRTLAFVKRQLYCAGAFTGMCT